MLRWKDDQEEWQGVVQAAEDSLENRSPSPAPYQCKCKGMVGGVRKDEDQIDNRDQRLRVGCAW